MGGGEGGATFGAEAAACWVCRLRAAEGREGARGEVKAGRGEARLQPLSEDGIDRLDVDAVEVVLAAVVVRGRLELRHLAALAVDRPPQTLAVHDLHAEVAAQLVAQLVLPRARRVGSGKVEGVRLAP